MMLGETSPKPPSAVAVVIPCYRERAHILDVIAKIGPQVSKIYVVDDACPDQTGAFVATQCRDPRVAVLTHPINLGVGGATITGYRQALGDGMAVIVKIDGDGQMDPALLAHFVEPLLAGDADYTKGNRFYHLESLHAMPWGRLIGNALLTFLTKISSGYWNLFDPTNGYTAIHANVVRELALDKLRPDFFFESDMLFRLNILRAHVVDIPMRALYQNERSSLRIGRVVLPFIYFHLRNGAKRIFYNYFLRDFSIATLELLTGLGLLAFGTAFGAYQWHYHASIGNFASAGTVLLAVLPLLVGVQLLLSFLGYDIGNVPKRPIHPFLAPRATRPGLPP